MHLLVTGPLRLGHLHIVLQRSVGKLNFRFLPGICMWRHGFHLLPSTCVCQVGSLLFPAPARICRTGIRPFPAPSHFFLGGSCHFGQCVSQDSATAPIRHPLPFRFLIPPCRIPRQEGIADLPVGVRVGGIVEPCVEGQHAAALAAVVAPPDILREVDVHLAPAVSAERAVRIHAVRLAAAHPQVEQLRHVPDPKGESLRIRVTHGPALLSFRL